MSLGRTCICADDGRFYHCSVIWLYDWACLSFSDGEIELLVAVDGGRPRDAIRNRRVPVVIDKPLIGVRVFADRNGVKRTWRAYEAQPTVTVKGFPRCLIPRDQEPTTKPCGVFLFRCGVHDELLRVLESRRERDAKQAAYSAVELAGV